MQNGATLKAPNFESAVTAFLFWFLAALVSWPLFRAMAKPERIYEFPHFMAAIFAIFILPQAISLIRFPGAASELAVQEVLVVSCLCLGACLVGYRFRPRRIAPHVVLHAVNEQRLFFAGILFVASGLWFSYLLSHIQVQTSEMGGWTGPATIYGFFQQLCYPGFAICLMLAIRRPSLFSISASLLASIVPIQSVLFGRREPAALFALTIGLTLYFQLGLRPARWLVAGTIAISMLAIPATATYRRFQLHNDWEGVRQIDLVDNFKEFLSQESVLELRNAAMLIEATRRSGDYEYGAGYWNHLIFRYVPAQILGESFKQSLQIRVPREGLERELAGMDYVNPPGSTVTAMGDSFQEFGYWGCLFFAALAVLFRRLWQAATRPDALFTQLLYMQSCTCAMRAVTHWTLDFLPGLLYNALFLGAAMAYASFGRSLSRAAVERRTSAQRPRPPANLPGKTLQGSGLRCANLALLAQRSGDDKDQHCPAQAAAEKKVQ